MEEVREVDISKNPSEDVEFEGLNEQFGVNPCVCR